MSGTLVDSGPSLSLDILSTVPLPSRSGDCGGGRVSTISSAGSAKTLLLSFSFSSSMMILLGGVGGVLGGLVGFKSGGEGFDGFGGEVGVLDDSELLRLILSIGVSLF